jgi:fumarate reductase subunit D
MNEVDVKVFVSTLLDADSDGVLVTVEEDFVGAMFVVDVVSVSLYCMVKRILDS